MGITVSKSTVATVSFSTPQEIIITHADDSIKIGDGTDLVDVTAANALKVDGSAVTQPVSAATTDTKLDSLLTELQLKSDNTESQPVKTPVLFQIYTFVDGAGASNQDFDLSTGIGTIVLDFNSASPWFGTVNFLASIDGTEFFDISGTDIILLDGQIPQSSAGVNHSYSFNVAGFKTFRLRNLGVTGSDVTVALGAHPGISVLNQLQAVTYITSSSALLVDGSAVTQPVSFASYATQVDQPDSSTTYVGKAVIGSSSASAVWQIQKLAVSGTVTTATWADSDSNFDNVWTNRASLTYG